MHGCKSDEVLMKVFMAYIHIDTIFIGSFADVCFADCRLRYMVFPSSFGNVDRSKYVIRSRPNTDKEILVLRKGAVKVK